MGLDARSGQYPADGEGGLHFDAASAKAHCYIRQCELDWVGILKKFITSVTFQMEEPETTITIKRPPLPPILKVEPKKDDSRKELEKAEDQGLVIEKSDSLAERVRKMNLIKRQGSTERDSRERSVPFKEYVVNGCAMMRALL